MIGSGGADAITGDNEDDTGTGSDLIIGDTALLTFNSAPVVTETDKDPQAFVDTLSGGSGTDTIYGGRGSDNIYGDNADGTGSGNDTVYGDSGVDTIHAGAGDDVVFGDYGKFINGDRQGAGDRGGEVEVIYTASWEDTAGGGGTTSPGENEEAPGMAGTPSGAGRAPTACTATAATTLSWASRILTSCSAARVATCWRAARETTSRAAVSASIP